jgi:indoleamine 2,3-dioxygenase
MIAGLNPDQLPMLDFQQITEMAEIRRAYSVLSFLAHAYVWGDLSDAKKVLPACIAVAWFALSEKLGLKPIVSYAGVDIMNYGLFDENKELELTYVFLYLSMLNG